MGKKAGKKKSGKSKIKEETNLNKNSITPKKKKNQKNKKIKRKSKSVKSAKDTSQQNSKNIEKTLVSNGEVELDQAVEDVARYRIVEAKPSEYEDKYYAVTLNYTNVQNNNNKFYIIQLLQDIHTKKFGVLYRWGRIGFFGQVNYVIYQTFEEAREAFLIKLQGKLEYGYIKIKMQNKIKQEKNNDELDTNDDGLEKPLANLIRLIFDLKSMNQQMMKIGYDSDKIPLGQLSPQVISQGYKFLKNLENIIGNINDKKSINTKEIYDLSSKYFTIIPHNFGMNNMHKFVINSQERIKEENELLDSIKNIKIVSGILQQTNNNNKEKNEISLKEKLNEFKYDVAYVSKEENIYSIIDKYLSKSNEIKNSPKIKLIDLFSVKEKNSINITNNKNKKLLWYGIRIQNFANVFKSGLSLPPPEAPIYSYMFGKGIYFSDVAIKSFYNSHPQNNIGLMLLCEVDLGNIEERLKADVNLPNTLEQGKNSVKVLGMNFPDEKGSYFDENGIEIPLGDILINQDENKKTYFGFNEYIVYNLDQIKIKYILKVQFDKS
jgi:poly [ADP-ribose] polymerase